MTDIAIDPVNEAAETAAWRFVNAVEQLPESTLPSLAAALDSGGGALLTGLALAVRAVDHDQPVMAQLRAAQAFGTVRHDENAGRAVELLNADHEFWSCIVLGVSDVRGCLLG